MNILITGAKGQLGNALASCLQQGKSEIGALPEALLNAQVKLTDIDDFDITNLSSAVTYVGINSPDVIINCAAYTNVDGCEKNESDAMLLNALGARNLAIAAKKINAKLIHVSTDYVFSGKAQKAPLSEYDLTGPVSVYGKTKLLGEEYAREFCKKTFIVRTAWLYGYSGKNFVKTIANLAKTKEELSVVNDQIGNPTNAQDLAHHILKLACSEEYGVYHCTGEGICSWFDFASEIVRLSGGNAKLEPVTSEQYKKMNPNAADRPAYSALENRMLTLSVGNEMRNWKQALECYFKNWNGE